jgi:hypothetical protein
MARKPTIRPDSLAAWIAANEQTKPAAPEKPGAEALQMRIEIAMISPAIWRRLRVPEASTFEQLHHAILRLFSWSGRHSHIFRIGGESVSDPRYRLEEAVSEFTTSLSRYRFQPGDTLQYVYDFESVWDCRIRIEKREPLRASERLPRCIAGKRAGPPERSGGVYGYRELVQTIEDRRDEEEEDPNAWPVDDFDPEAFNLDEINHRLAGAR